MSKLDDILEFDSLANLHHETKALFKQQIIDLFLELIGENKDPLEKPDATEYLLITGENRLRAELCTKAESL